MVLELNGQTFHKTIKASTPVIVDFWASWCGPCRMMAPVFEQLSHDFKGKLEFAKVSTEDHPELAGESEVAGIPCLIVFKNGKEIDRIVGYAPAPTLKKKIEDVLARA